MRAVYTLLVCQALDRKKGSLWVEEYCIGQAAWDSVFEGGEVGDEEIIMIVCYR
jgi:hypothetical protein